MRSHSFITKPEATVGFKPRHSAALAAAVQWWTQRCDGRRVRLTLQDDGHVLLMLPIVPDDQTLEKWVDFERRAACIVDEGKSDGPPARTKVSERMCRLARKTG